MLGRRSFLKATGGLLLAGVAAPLVQASPEEVEAYAPAKTVVDMGPAVAKLRPPGIDPLWGMTRARVDPSEASLHLLDRARPVFTHFGGGRGFHPSLFLYTDGSSAEPLRLPPYMVGMRCFGPDGREYPVAIDRLPGGLVRARIVMAGAATAGEYSVRGVASGSRRG